MEITLTDIALVKVREFQQAEVTRKGKFFRIAVDAGGCSGFLYDYSFDDRRDGDITIPLDGVTVVIDKESLPLLLGSTIDYIEDFHGSGFATNNPNSTKMCGCGKSFGA